MWHLDKKEPRIPDLSESHGIIVILHYGKYQGAMMPKRELIRMVGLDHDVLEL